MSACSGSATSRAFTTRWRSTKELVKIDPVAIELVDRTMLELSRANPTFAPTIERYVEGRPDAILLVEFTGDDARAAASEARRARRVHVRARLSKLGRESDRRCSPERDLVGALGGTRTS